MIENTLSSVGANRAYRAAKSLDIAPTPRMAAIEEVARPSFAQVLEATAVETVQTVRAGESAAIAGLQGQMPMQKVVEATMAMESAVKVTVALRDKVVEAYQEILRMSI